MFPATLITFREVLEASLIIAAILGILIRLEEKRSIKTLIIATILATLISVGLIIGGSVVGLQIQEKFQGKVKEIFEGVMMITTAFFITWAVFVLHSFLTKYKKNVIGKVRESIEKKYQIGLFVLVFTAVFREGLEIVLFLSTLFLTENPTPILQGFLMGSFLALGFALIIFVSTLRVSVRKAMQATSILLIFFAAGLLMRGLGELSEAGVFVETISIDLPLIPQPQTLLGSALKSIFGLTPSISIFQSFFYISYVAIMFWWLFIKKSRSRIVD